MRTDTTKEPSSQRGVDFNQESLNLEPMHMEWTARLMFWILDQDKIGAFDLSHYHDFGD